MSTEINVTVEDESLIDIDMKYRRQNRQNEQLRRQNNQAILAEEQKKRQDLQKKPAPAKSAAKVRKDEPAASSSLNSLVLRPTLPPDANQWFDPDVRAAIPLQSNGGYPRVANSDTSNTYGLARPTYFPTQGPSEAPALAAVPVGSLSSNYVTLTASSPPNKVLNQFTVQLYFRMGTSVQTYQPFPEILLELGPISMFFSIESGSSLRKVFQYSIYAGGRTTDIYSANSSLGDIGSPMLRAGVWHHVAMTLRAGVATAYFDGQALSQVTLPALTVELLKYGLSRTDWLTLGFGQSVTGFINPAQPVYVHGLRFEPKCRWLSDFTPPARLP
jgi:hypothetical protein